MGLSRQVATESFLLHGCTNDTSVDAAGGAAAIAALKPPENAKDHDDDKKCPEKDNECEACDGKNQICTSGADSGCEFHESRPSEGANLNQRCL